MAGEKPAPGFTVRLSEYLVEDGEPCDIWKPCGGGWKVKRRIVPKVPYRGAGSS